MIKCCVQPAGHLEGALPPKTRLGGFGWGWQPGKPGCGVGAGKFRIYSHDICWSNQRRLC
jgi:hypothetical protein